MPARILAFLGVLLWSGLWGAAGRAEDVRPVVVELYTSQGCSSCPPADAMLRDLTTRPDVIPLALHVDYWDYIGWADVFARPEFTRRQQAYARAAGERAVYTPQIIVGGVDHVIGARPMELHDRIARHAALATGVTLRVRRDAGRLSVRAEAAAPAAMLVQLVRYRPEETVEILRGENAGRSLVYSNIVTSWERVADWDGTTPLTLDLAVEGTEPAVVIVQAAGPGLILAAGRD